jgi:hypothetical protein
MSRLVQIVVTLVFSLIFFMPAQAGFDIAISKQCVIFADEASDDSKKEGDDKKEGGDKKQGAEPDCD